MQGTGLRFGPLSCVVISPQLQRQLEYKLKDNAWSEGQKLWKVEGGDRTLENLFNKLHFQTFEGDIWKIGYLPLGVSDLKRGVDAARVRYDFILKCLFWRTERFPCSLYDRSDIKTKAFIRHFITDFLDGRSRRTTHDRLFQRNKAKHSKGLEQYEAFFEHPHVKPEEFWDVVPHLAFLSVLLSTEQQRLQALGFLKEHFPDIASCLSPRLEAIQRLLLCDDVSGAEEYLIKEPVVDAEDMSNDLAPVVYCSNLLITAAMGEARLVSRDTAAKWVNSLPVPESQDLFPLHRHHIDALAMCCGSQTARKTLRLIISDKGYSEVEQEYAIKMLASMWDDEVVSILVDLFSNSKSNNSRKAAILDSVILAIKTLESFEKSKKEYRTAQFRRIKKLYSTLKTVLPGSPGDPQCSTQLTLSLISFFAEFPGEDIPIEFLLQNLQSPDPLIRIKALSTLFSAHLLDSKAEYSEQQIELFRDLIVEASSDNRLNHDLASVLNSLKRKPELASLAINIMAKGGFIERLLRACNTGTAGTVWSYCYAVSKVADNTTEYIALMKKAFSLNNENILLPTLGSLMDKTIPPAILGEVKDDIVSCMDSPSSGVAEKAVEVCDRYFLNIQNVREKIYNHAFNRTSACYLQASKCVEERFSLFAAGQDKDMVARFLTDRSQGLAGFDSSATSRLVEAVESNNYINRKDVLFNLSMLRIYSQLLRAGKVDAHWNNINPIISYLKEVALAFSLRTTTYKEIKDTFFSLLRAYQVCLLEYKQIGDDFISPLKTILEPTKIKSSYNRPGIKTSWLLVHYLGFSRVPEPPTRLRGLLANLAERIYRDFDDPELLQEESKLRKLFDTTREKIKATALQTEEDEEITADTKGSDRPDTPLADAVDKYLNHRSRPNYRRLVEEIDKKITGQAQVTIGAGSPFEALGQLESPEEFFWRHSLWVNERIGRDGTDWYGIIRNILHDYNRTWEYWSKEMPSFLFVRRLLTLPSTANRFLVDQPERIDLKKELQDWERVAKMEYGQGGTFKIVKEFPPERERLLIDFDRRRFHAILNNCLTNGLAAVEVYNQRDGVEQRDGVFVIAVKKVEKEGGSSQESQEIVITFTDNGTGFYKDSSGAMFSVGRNLKLKKGRW